MKWQAHWIWPKEGGSGTNQYVDFRRAFSVPTVIGTFSVHITCRNEYRLYVNGVKFGQGPSPCDAKWMYYDSYDITALLRQGQNVIGVVGYHFGEKDIYTQQMQGEAGFLAQLEHTAGEAEDVLLVSDPSWKCRYSPRWSAKTERISRWGGFKEIYSAKREDGWELPDYDDSAWPSAAMLASAEAPDSPWPRLLPREIPFLASRAVLPESIVRFEENFGSVRRMEEEGIEGPYVIDAARPGAFPGIVFDFGREVVGYPEITVEAPEGGVLRIAYGESLELQFVDAYVLKQGLQTLSPYGRRACRFMHLMFAAAPQPIELIKLSFRLVHYPYEASAVFQSQDGMLDRIWDISRYTTLMNSQDHLEDCPWREKALWVVDAIVMAKVIYHVFGDSQLIRKCLLQGARIQNENGSIPGTGPEANSTLLPDFCAYWLIGVYDYWKYTGDLDIVEKLWPTMNKLVNWFHQETDSSGLFANADRAGFWCFIDWTDDIDKRDKVSAISFLFYKVLSHAAELAAVLGHEEEVQRYKEWSTELLQAMRDNLWIPEHSLFADCMAGDVRSDHTSLQTNFLAAWCGVLTTAEIRQFIRETYAKGVLLPVKGPFFQHIVLEVLCGVGESRMALDLIRDYWGAMVQRGATTWWETFDASTPSSTIPSTYQGNTPTYLWEAPPTSSCHAWGASPGYLLIRLVLGIDVSDLGSEKVYVHAPAVSLPGMNGSVPTRHGPIEIEWISENRAKAIVPQELIVVSGDGTLLDIEIR